MKRKPEDISSLEARIATLKKKEFDARKAKKESEAVHASKSGFRVGTELLSGVLVGAAIGYLLDRFLNTQPWLLVLFIFLGGGAGVLNVYRFVKSEESRRKE